ncbi:hypothetical protein SANTM175S_07613 [Streptomyces antimycoticus]
MPFHGRRQAGITTPLQAHGHLLAFDLAPGANRKAAAALLRRWSRTAQGLMAGETPPDGTGIALDAGPSSLTVTFGFGRTFFGKAGLGDQLPEALAPLPDFVSDELDPKRGDGDLWIQIGADDALVGYHALRALLGFRDDGAPDAGLLFIAWQADPMKGFVPVQRKLDLGDDLSRFLRHEASALFAVPPGCAPGEYVGQALLEG